MPEGQKCVSGITTCDLTVFHSRVTNRQKRDKSQMLFLNNNSKSIELNTFITQVKTELTFIIHVKQLFLRKQAH